MKLICFSLWGSNRTYTIGALRNADLALSLFPEWKCLFYCLDSVPVEIVDELHQRSNTLIRRVPGTSDDLDSRGMFYRFLPADEKTVDYMVSRDTDSRLSERERLAVEEWLTTGADLHVMRDHPYHGVPILGGMWGAKGGKLKGISEAIQRFQPTSSKGQDQAFLRDWVWPKVTSGQLNVCVHDPFFQKAQFPAKATRGAPNGGVSFIGQCFDENDRPNSVSDLTVLMKKI